MEELDLKTIWQENETRSDRFYTGMRAEVLTLAQRRSQSALARIKRNIAIEAGVGLGVCVCLAVAVGLYTTEVYFFLGVILLAFISSVIPYFWLWRKMQGIQEERIIVSLHRQIVVLKKYIRHVVRLITWLIPLTYLIGYFFGATRGGAPLSEVLTSYKLWIIALVLGGITGVVLNYLIRKYMYITIGKHVDTLAGICRELENDNHPAGW